MSSTPKPRDPKAPAEPIPEDSPRRTLLLWTVIPPLIILYLVYVLQIHVLIPELFGLAEFPTSMLSLDFLVYGPLGAHMREKGKEGTAATASALKPFVRHIVAVGDLHGDMPNARRVLQFSGVVDDFGNWTGHADFFVQTGDIIDRCVPCGTGVVLCWVVTRFFFCFIFKG